MTSFFAKISQQYKGVGEILRSYFSIYGGFTAIASSPYLHFSVLFVLITSGTWRQPTWWDLPISVLPGMISFSLAGFAMLMAFGDQAFKKVLSDKNPSASVILGVGSTFTHFIIIQIIALLLAIIFKSRPLSTLMSQSIIVNDLVNLHQIFFITLKNISWGFGFLFFIYAVVSAAPAALSIFRTTRWFNQFSADQE